MRRSLAFQCGDPWGGHNYTHSSAKADMEDMQSAGNLCGGRLEEEAGNSPAQPPDAADVNPCMLGG